MTFIPVNEPLLNGNEKKYLAECIDSGWISSEGPFVRKFEEEFSERMGRKHGIAVTNGTAAIDASITALEIGPGDEVIMPTFTIISCIMQIIRSGAKPILVDSDPLTWNVDTELIEKKITPKTKAIVMVHIYGLPVDIDPIIKLCQKYDLKLLEDAAEMIGQTYRARPCGSFGDISTFSFYPNKHITTGEGGMILTDDDDLARQCRELRNLCFQPNNRFVHQRLGWNMRMTNLQAAVGVAQLEQLDLFVTKKRWIGKTYRELLSDCTNIKFQSHKTDYAENIYWVFGLMIDNTICDAKSVMNKLGKMGIGTRPFFFPMHQQPILRELGLFKGEKYPVAEKLYQQGFYLPSGLSMNSEKINQVVKALKIVIS